MIEIKKTATNNYVFSVKAESGNSILNSVEFSSEDEVKNQVKYLNSLKDTQNVFERKTNHNGKFLFNLKNGQGNLVGSSQLFSSEAGMENGIKNLKNRIDVLVKAGNL